MKKVLLRDDVPCFMPAVVPHGAMASLPQPNTSYITIIGFQLVRLSLLHDSVTSLLANISYYLAPVLKRYRGKPLLFASISMRF